MRAFRTLIIIVVLFIVCTAAKSAFRKSERNLSKSAAINSYINAVKNGKPGKLNKFIAPKATFVVVKDSEPSNCSKQQMMAYVKQNKNVEGDFKAKSKIIDNTGNNSVVKVDIRSNNLTSDNYITIANAGNGWKITNVYSVVK